MNVDWASYDVTLPLGGSDVSASGEGVCCRIADMCLSYLAFNKPSPRLGSTLPEGGWHWALKGKPVRDRP